MISKYFRAIFICIVLFALTSSCEDKKRQSFGKVNITFDYQETIEANNVSENKTVNSTAHSKLSQNEFEREQGFFKNRESSKSSLEIDVIIDENEDLIQRSSEIKQDYCCARITVNNGTPLTLDLSSQNTYSKTVPIGSTLLEVDLLTFSNSVLYKSIKNVQVAEDVTTSVNFLPDDWVVQNQIIEITSNFNTSYEIGEEIDLSWTNTHAARGVIIEMTQNVPSNVIKVFEDNFVGNSYTINTNDESPKNNIGITVKSTMNETSYNRCCFSIVANNEAPTVENINETIDEDQSIEIQFDGNDADGDNISYSILSNPSSGTLGSINNDKITYSPNQNFNGTDSFTYKANDGTEDSNTATVSITIQAVNDAPTTNDVSTTIDENRIARVANLTLDGNDVDGDDLTYSLLTSPSNGSVSINGNILTYNADQDWNGTETFTYKANDGQVDSNVSNITITVTPVNDPPTTGDDISNYSLHFDGSGRVQLPSGFFDNVGEPNSSFSISMWVRQHPNSIGSDGTLISGVASPNYYLPLLTLRGDSTIDFYHDGPEGQFYNKGNISLNVNEWNHVVYVSDGDQGFNTLFVNNVVDVVESICSGCDLSSSPKDWNLGSWGGNNFDGKLDDVAIWNTALTQDDINTLYNNGELKAANSIKASALQAYYNFEQGSGSTISDISGNNNQASIIGSASYDESTPSPQTTYINVTTDEDLFVDINLAEYVTDIDGDDLTFEVVSSPQHGTTAFVSSDVIRYQPIIDYNGQDSFTWKANDGVESSNIVTVKILIAPINDSPISNDLNLNTDKNTPITINLDGSDIDGDNLSYFKTSDPSDGTITFCDPCIDNQIIYTPNSSFFGTDSFTYKTNDGSDDSNVSTVNITVARGAVETSLSNQEVNYGEFGILSFDTDFSQSFEKFLFKIYKLSVNEPDELIVANYNTDEGPVNNTVGTNTAIVTDFVIPFSGEIFENNTGSFTNYKIESLVTKNCDGSNGCQSIVVDIDTIKVNGIDQNMVIDKSAGSGDYAHWDRVPITFQSGEVTSTRVDLIGTDIGRTMDEVIVLSGNFSKTINFDLEARDEFRDTDQDYYFIISDINKINDYQSLLDERGFSTNWYLYNVKQSSMSGVGANGGDWRFFEHDTLNVEINEPEFTFTSPSDNAVFKPGQEYEFTWNSKALSNADIRIMLAGQTIITENDGNEIITFYTSDLGLEPQSTLTNTLISFGAINVYSTDPDYNNGNSIATQAIQKTVSIDASDIDFPAVLNPNGGEVLYFDRDTTFEWNFEGISDSVYFALSSSDWQNPEYVKLIKNTGSYTTQIPSDDLDSDGLEDGQYYLQISSQNAGPFSNTATEFWPWYADSSDNIITFENNNKPVLDYSVQTIIRGYETKIPINVTDADNDDLTFTIDQSPQYGSLSFEEDSDGNYFWNYNQNIATPNNNNVDDIFTFYANDGKEDSDTQTAYLNIVCNDDSNNQNSCNNLSLNHPSQGSFLTPGDNVKIYWNNWSSDIDINLRRIDSNGAIIETINIADDYYQIYSDNGQLDHNPYYYDWTIPTDLFNNFSETTFEMIIESQLGVYENGFLKLYSFNDNSFGFTINSLPNVSDGIVTTNEDESININLVANDADNHNLTYTVQSASNFGTITVESSTATYTPNPNMNGSDQFWFKVNDGTSIVDGTIAVNVTPVNDAPTTNDISQTIDENRTNRIIGITLDGNDVDGDNLSYSIVSMPSNGSAALEGNILTYNANQDWNGIETITYKANDGELDSNISTITITVNAVDDPIVIIGSGDTSNDKSLYFDGNDDKIDFNLYFPGYSVNSNTSVNQPAETFGLGHVTVSFWMKLDTDSANFGDMQIFGDIEGNNSLGLDHVFQMLWFDGRLVANFRDNNDFEQIDINVEQFGFNPLEWNHIVWVNEHGMDGTSQGGSGSGQQNNLNQGHRLFVNGSFVGSHYHSGGQILTDTGMRIGSEADSDNGSLDYKGYLDAFAIWDVEIGPNAIQEIFEQGRDIDLRQGMSHYVSNGDLKLFYNFDDFDNLAKDYGYGYYQANPVQDGIISGTSWGSGTYNQFTTDEDVPISIDLSEYVINVDNDNLVYFIDQNGQHGNAVINQSIVTYTPNLNYYGTDSFTWIVNDGTNNTVTSRVDIIINDVANDPTANNITLANGVVNTSMNITLDGEDEAGFNNPLTYYIVDAPSRGSVSGINSSVTESKSALYTPDANMIGVDSFTYKVNNGFGDSNIATVLVGISNNKPNFSDLNLTSDEDITYSYTLPDKDSDGDEVTYSIVENFDSLNNGTAVISSGNIFTYIPEKDWNGSGEEFTVRANDRILNGDTFKINVTVNPVNDIPIVRNPEWGVPEDGVWPFSNSITQSSLNNALGYDPDNEAISGYNIITNFKHGNISYTGDGIRYYPTQDFFGQDSLIYTVYNSTGTSEEGVWIMNVTPVNDPPEATNVYVTLSKNIPKSIDLFSENSNQPGNNYVYDIDNETSELFFEDVNSVQQYQNISIVVNENGILTLTPTQGVTLPSNEWNTYSRVSDGEDLSNIISGGGNNGRGYVYYQIINDHPVPDDISVTTDEDLIVSVTLTASDINGDNLTYEIDDSTIDNGTVNSTTNQTFLFTPNSNWNGNEVFNYEVFDGDKYVGATVTVTVNPVNDAPTTNDISTSTNEETSLDITLDGNDIDNDNLSYIIVTDASNGTTSLNGNILTYTPSIDFDGNDAFTYKANDGTEDSNVSTVSIVVNEAGDEFVKYFELSSSNTLTNIRQIVPTSDNGSIIVGTAESSAGSNRVYVLKLDADSNKELDEYFTVGNLDEAQGMSIDETSDGGYVIAGYGEDGSDIQAYVMKVNSSLQLEWSEVFGNVNSSATGNDDRFYSVQAQDNGDIRAVGRTNSWVANTADDDVYIANLSSSGSSSWPYWIRAANTRFSTTSVSDTPGTGGTEYSNGSNAIDGSYFVGAYTNQSLHGRIWSIEDVGTNIKGQWSRALPENGLDIAQSVVGSVTGGYSGGYAAASSQSPGGVSNWSQTYTDIESVTGFVHLNSFNYGYVLVGENQDLAQPRIGIIKIDDSGNQEWLSTFSTDNAAYDYGRFVAETYDGYLFVLGETKDQTTNNKRIVLLKINSNGESERF